MATLHLKESFVKFPVTLMAFAICAGISIYINELDFQVNKAIYRIFCSIFLGAFILFLINLWQTNSNISFAKKYSKSMLLIRTFLGVIFILSHYYITKNMVYINYSVKYLHLLLIIILCVSIIPVITKKSSKDFWIFNRFLILRMFTSSCFATLIMVGVSIALIITNYLLEFNITHIHYLNAASVCFLIILPIIFLNKFSAHVSLESNEYFSSLHRVLGYYFFIPAVIVYSVILYLYFGNMLYSSAWPKNLISYIVVFYTICGFISHILIYPEYLNNKKSWVSNYIKLFYLTLMPLLALFFYSIIIRINQYGITIRRGFLFLLGIWFISAVIYFLKSKVQNIITLPITLLLLLIVSYTGSLSIYNIAIYSQKKRLSSAIDISEQNNINKYLSEYHGVNIDVK